MWLRNAGRFVVVMCACVGLALGASGCVSDDTAIPVTPGIDAAIDSAFSASDASGTVDGAPADAATDAPEVDSSAPDAAPVDAGNDATAMSQNRARGRRRGRSQPELHDDGDDGPGDGARAQVAPLPARRRHVRDDAEALARSFRFEGGLMVGRVRRAAGAAIFLATLSAGSAMASVPQLLTEQGQLLDSSGNPVAGSIQISFAIYNTPTGGTALWTEAQTITLDEGFFSAILGQTAMIPPNLFNGATLYLGVTVGTDPEMTPRQAIYSVPYALVAGNAVGDITPTSVTINGLEVINDAGVWVGPPTGLVGGRGRRDPRGRRGPRG